MSAAFDVVFGLFVLAIVALAVVAVRWGVRRDRLARANRAEHQEAGKASNGVPSPPGTTPDRRP